MRTASTTQKNTSCVPTSTIWPMLQSKATAAPCRTGAAVMSTSHAPTSKRRSSVCAVMPANTAEISSCPGVSVFTQSTPFFRIAG